MSVLITLGLASLAFVAVFTYRAYTAEPGPGQSPRSAIIRLTAGLKCAPDTGPNTRMSTTSIAPVGKVLRRELRDHK